MSKQNDYFGPKFTGGILTDNVTVEYNSKTGPQLVGNDRVNLENHQAYKNKMLEKLADENWVEWQDLSKEYRLTLD